MDKEVASEVNKIIVDGYAMLHASIDSVRRAFGGDELKTYCAVVGRVLGYMLLDLMDPLHRDYPDLAPHYLTETAEETTGEQEMEVDAENTFLSLHRGEESSGRQTRLVMLMADLTAEIERTVSLVRDHCQEGEAADYHQRAAEVLVRLDEAKAHVLASNIDVGVPYNPVAPNV